MDVVFWLGWLNLWGSWIHDLPHWFTSVAVLWTFSKISPKRSLENLTSDDLRSFKLCFHASWLPNCSTTSSVSGLKTVIEIRSFQIGAVKEVHIVRTKCFQVGIHCSVNSYKCRHDGKNAFIHSVIFSKSGR